MDHSESSTTISSNEKCDITVTSPIKQRSTSNLPLHKIEFTSPLLINNVNDNIVNFNNDVRFDKNTLFERNNNLSVNGTLYLNSESSIYFDYLNNPNNKLTHKDVEPIKMAKAKSLFLINATSDVSQFENDKRVSTFSSQTGGNSKCTSTIWDIITGKQPPGSELCKNCCKKSKGKGIVKAVIMQNDGVINEIVLDLDQGTKLHMKKDCNVRRVAKILLFKSEEEIKCRLVLLSHKLDTDDKLIINNTINKIKERDTSSDANKDYYEINSENVPWGVFKNGVVSESEHLVNSNRTFVTAYLEYLK